ncbi:MAG: hypothetical protein GX892_08060 [Thermoanaerobacteraceae bacterium]|nr:hypothetical protein [Thermoanaerobacteraceae bacterium]
MHRPTKLEFASHMLTYKENLKQLTESIKDLESQIDDSLQHTLKKSSSLVKLNKGMKEIELLSQALTDINENKNYKAQKILLTSFRRKLFENQCLLMEEIQKSMLKAAEAMIDAGNGITIMSSFINMSRVLENFEKKVKST